MYTLRFGYQFPCVCACVCVCASMSTCVCASMCLCVCVCAWFPILWSSSLTPAESSNSTQFSHSLPRDKHQVPSLRAWSDKTAQVQVVACASDGMAINQRFPQWPPWIPLICWSSSPDSEHLSDRFFQFVIKRYGFPGGASGKDPACQCRRCKRHGFDPWVGKISWRRAWQPTAVFLPGKSHARRGLAGYSPWGHRELDATEHQAHIYRDQGSLWFNAAG